MFKNKKIISLVTVIMIGMSFFEGFNVQAENNLIKTQDEREILYKFDFSDGVGKWVQSGGKGFIVLNQELTINNVSKIKNMSSIISPTEVENAEITFEMSIGKGKCAGVIFRQENEKTHYSLRVYPQNKKVAIVKLVNGGEMQEIASKYLDIDYKEKHNFSLTLINSNIECGVDGNTLLSVKDKSITKGKIGFYAESVNAVFDNLEVFKYKNIDYEVRKENPNSKNKKTIYVSNEADESISDGSIEKPFKTIEKAQEIVRELKKNNTPVDVVLKGGIYERTDTITFSSADSGTEDAPIRYIAEEGEKVVFTGAKKVDVLKFVPVDETETGRLPENSKNNVLKVDLAAQGFTADELDFTKYKHDNVTEGLKALQVTLNGKNQRISRWPNSGYNLILDSVEGDNERNGGSKNVAGCIFYKGNRPDRWVTADNMFVEGYLANQWHGQWALIDKIDTDKKSINFKYYTKYGILKDNRWAVVNLLEEIDIPGEWYIDFDKLIMYYYPPYKLSESDDLSIGVMNKNMFDFVGASNIILENLDITMTKNDPLPLLDNDNGGNGILITDNSKNITIKDCRLYNIGMSGIVINSDNVTVDGCVINSTGYNGITAKKCGSRNPLRESNVVIKNCDISNPSRDSGSGGFASIVLSMNTVGVEVLHNVLHNAQNSGIRYSGLSNYFAYNEIYNAVTKSADAGAIYAGRSWADYGNVFEYNFIHDIGQQNNISEYPASAIFWDDYQSGQEFRNNICVINNYKKTSAVKIGGGLDNVVTGNTMVSANWDIIGEDRNAGISQDVMTYARSILLYSTVPAYDTEYLKKYPLMSSLTERVNSNNNVIPLTETITDNLTVDCVEDSKISQNMLNVSEYGNNTKIKGKNYEIFVNPNELDFRVKKEMKSKYGIPDKVLDEDFNINLIGIQKEMIISDEDKSFDMIYPENNSTNLKRTETELVWTKSKMADTYSYVVAKDKDFEDVIISGNTQETSVMLDGLENGCTYYWKVSANNNSRQNKYSISSQSGVMSFTVEAYEILEKDDLIKSIEKARGVLSSIKEGKRLGEYKPGTLEIFNVMIEKAQELNAKEVGNQQEVDDMAYELSKAVDGIDAYINSGYVSLKINKDSDWKKDKAEQIITKNDKSVRLEAKNGFTATLNETLSNYNVICFKAKPGSYDGNSWFAFGLKGKDYSKIIWSQGGYYIVAKQNIFELQYSGTILEIKDNNGILKAGEWNDIQLGAITTENGINLIFVVNGEIVFDYLVKDTPVYSAGMFAAHISSNNNVLEIAEADNVPDVLFEYSEKIKAEISKKAGDGDVLSTDSEGYVESGTWAYLDDKTGDRNSKIRVSSETNASAKWIMNAGTAGNGKIYKVYYYHVPDVNGDKNVEVYVNGYGGDYTKTIDLSSGEEGYVEIGTFKFIDADYIGRLSITFKGSGTGKLNVSNVKFEKTEDGENLLK